MSPTGNICMDFAIINIYELFTNSLIVWTDFREGVVPWICKYYSTERWTSEKCRVLYNEVKSSNGNVLYSTINVLIKKGSFINA